MKLITRQFFAIALLPLALYSCSTLKPLAPANIKSDIPAIVQPVSNIEVPVTVDLKSYFLQAENSVPVKYADNQQPCEGLRYSYVFTRTPFVITGANNVFKLKFMGNYGFIASYCSKCTTIFGSSPSCLHPTPSAECGMGNEPPRRMEIAYQSTLNILPDFSLRSKTILSPAPKPIDRCNVFMGNIDVTDRLIQYITAPLNDLGKQVDAKIAAYNIRPMVEQIWNNLAGEMKIADVGYLNINPQAIRLSNFNLNGSMLNFAVGLSAKPVASTLSNPSPLKPLPNLTTYVPANGFSIYLDLVENYDHLNTMVKQQVAGMSIPVAGKTFTVDDVRIYGIGTKVAMQIDFKGSNNGTIYMVGTPTYDPVTHILSFPDLSFDLQSRAWMLKAANWMFNGKITDMVRQKATYNFTTYLTDNKAKLQTQLSRDMGNGIHSDVSIKDLNIEAIYPTPEKLIIRTLSNGQIKVKVVM